MKATRFLSLGALAGCISLQALAAEQSVTLNAAYNNVFNLNGDGSAGDYIYGESYTDLTTAQVIDISAGSAKLGPNIGYYQNVCIDGDKAEFWCGSDSSTPNKFVGLVAQGPLPGQPQLTLSADVTGIPTGYSAQLTVIGFTADYSGNYAFPPATTLTADGSLSATVDFTDGTLVNYVAQVILNGPIIDPADKTTVGYMTVSNLKATYADPTSPTAVTTSGVSDGSVIISWTKSTVAPVSYVVQQKSGSSSWTDVASVSWTESSYTATGYATDETVTFRVVADGFGADAESAASSTTIPAASAQPVPTTPVPALPLWALILLGGVVGLFGFRKVAQ